MAEILAVILAWVVAAVVVYPLLRPHRHRMTVEASRAEGDRLLAEKEAVYAALKELAFDHQIGKLTREDYEELRGLYQDRGVAVLQALDAIEIPSTIDDAIERDVAAARARRQTAATRHRYCVLCGAMLPQAARFCPQCGVGVAGEAS